MASVPAPDATLLVREAKLFQFLLQQRDRWYDQVLNDARVLAEEAADAEAELVHAHDRADFAEAQLDSLLRRAQPQSKGMIMPSPEHFKVAKEAEMQLSRHLELANEVSERKERFAWAVARLRVLQALCTWAESGSTADGDGALSNVLRRCEDDLLQACSGDVATARLATELQNVSPLNLVMPSLLGELRQDEYRKPIKGAVNTAEVAVPGQDQWLLPVKSPGVAADQATADSTAAVATGPEDVRHLRREIQELTDRNEALRSELSAASSRRTREPLPQFPLVEGNAHQSIEEISQCRASQQQLASELQQLTQGVEQVRDLSPPEQTARAARLQQIAQLRLALADAYAELAMTGLHVAPEGEGSEDPAELNASWERRLEEARAENQKLRSEVISEASRAGSNCSSPIIPEKTDLIQRIARNSSEIKVLKDHLRRAELADVRRRESQGRFSLSGNNSSGVAVRTTEAPAASGSLRTNSLATAASAPSMSISSVSRSLIAAQSRTPLSNNRAAMTTPSADSTFSRQITPPSPISQPVASPVAQAVVARSAILTPTNPGFAARARRLSESNVVEAISSSGATDRRSSPGKPWR